VWIVRNGYARRQKNVILYGRILRHIHIAVDFHPAPNDAFVIHCCVIPDSAIVPDPIPLTDNYSVSRLKSVPNFHRGVNHAPCPDLRVVPNHHGLLLDVPPRLVSQQDARINHAILS
jgi:hypothetical protein